MTSKIPNRHMPRPGWLGCVAAALVALCLPVRGAPQPILSGADWRDTAGNRIEAHEGGVIQEGGTFYLYGTDRSQNNSWFHSINMYSSTDLVHWTFRNKIMAYWSHADLNDRVVERPKILHCPSTGKYVLWWHHENSGYSLAEVGIATCDTIDGDYQLKWHWRPRGADSRDMSVFQDTDGKAYLIASVYGNTQSAIYQLSDDYTDCPTNAIYSSGGGINGEGHSILKVGGTYFWFKSGYGGWPPNDNYYSTATSMWGPWTNRGEFVPDGSVTFYSQCYNTLAVTGTAGTTYMFMGDRWHPNAHSQDRTIWLPLTISGTTASIRWYDAWTIDTVAGTWSSGSNVLAGGTYQIVSRATGKALGAYNWNGAPVEQLGYWGSDHQKWTVTHLGNTEGSYRITNVLSGKALDVSGNSSDNGAAIDVWDSNGGGNQKWRICPTDSGYYCLLGVNSRKALDLPGGSSEDWLDVVQWDRGGATHQEWAFIPVGNSNLPAAPQNLTARVPYGQHAKVRLDWTPLRMATSYQVKRSLSPEGPFTPVGGPVIVPSLTIDAAAGAAVYYTVAANNWFGAGADAAAVRFSPSALRARYAFEGDFKDTGTGVYQGTNSGATFGAGKVGGQAARFNGTSQSVSVPLSIGENDFTIAFWMKTTATGGTGDWWAGQGLVDAEVGGGHADFGTSLVGNKVAFGIGNPDLTITSATAVNNDAWHHVAATWNIATGQMKLYVDGVLESSANGARGARTTPPSVRIGRIQGGGGYFQGSLDDVRFYDIALSAADVASLAAAAGGPPLAGVVWDADGVAGGDTGGSGIWNTSAALWNSGGTMGTWNNTALDTAVFGGTGGAIDLVETITAGGLSFDNSYSFTGTGAINLTGLGPVTTALSTDTATFGVGLNGTGLQKNGGGRIVLDAANTLSSVDITAGTVEIAGEQDKNRLAPGALITVAAGAVLDFSGTNPTPAESEAASPSVVLNGGTLTASGGNHTHLADLTLNGGAVSTGSGAGEYHWERWLIWGDVTVGGSGLSSITGKGVGLAGNRTFTVADVSASPVIDLSVSVELNDSETLAGGVVKAGPGSMALNRNCAYTGGTTLQEGVLDLTGGGGAEGVIIGNCVVNTGATLRLSTQDALGYTGTGRRLSALLLDGGVMYVNTTANQTLGGAVVTLAQGGISGVTGSNLDFYQGNPAGATPSALVSLAADNPSTISGVRLGIRQAGGLTITTEDGNAATDLEIGSEISLSGTYPNAPLIKAGQGRLVLTGINTHTGPTHVNAGTLALTGSATLPTSALRIADGARFDVAGTTSGGFSLGAGTSFSGGRAAASEIDFAGNLTLNDATLDIAGITPLAGTLTIGGNLSLGDNLLHFDLADTPVTGDGVNDHLMVNGDLVLSGSNEIAVAMLGAYLANGTYTLATCTGTVYGTTANLTLTGLVPTTRQSFALAIVGKSVVLQVTGQPASLVWKGNDPANPARWDLNTTANWTGTDSKFQNADFVRFDDTASGFTVDLTGSVSPASVVVDNTTGFLFTGTGAIAGPVDVIKTGPGTLTVNCPNTYTGRMRIEGGRVAVSAMENVGQPSPLGAGDAVRLGSGVLAYTGAANDSTNRPIILEAADSTIEITEASATLDQAGSLTGSGVLTKSGPGSLMLTTANSHAGGTLVTAGTLIVDGNHSRSRLPANYVVNVVGGAFEIRGTNPLPDEANIGSFTIHSGGILRVVSGGSAKIGSAGESHAHLGNITLDGGTIEMTYSGAGTAWNGESFGLFGDLTVTGTEMSRILSTTTTSLSGMALDGARTIAVNDVAAGTDLLVSAQTQGSGSLIKTGAGTLEFSGNQTYAGATTVGQGDLKLNAATLTQSAVTVAAGAALRGTGAVNGNLTVHGTVAPGLGTGALTAGALVLTGTYACEVDGAAADALAIGSDLDLTGSTLSVGLLAGGFTAPHYVIATYGTLIGSFASVTPGYTVEYGKGTGFNEIWLLKSDASYDNWALANAGGQSADLDFDHDGVPNGIEYFMGATGSGFTANPAIGTDRRVTWPRDPAAVVSSFKVQVSENLSAWTDVAPADPDLQIAADSVSYTLPAGGGAKFCRLVVAP
ncbi:MAG: autotransporter-associated beta strand repeat-containing protein [Verrucomicrobia bacterium]|nr:autotransporter-associated beta strand repeat-containing protein [Verrucomicrobiota bacterium]